MTKNKRKKIYLIISLFFIIFSVIIYITLKDLNKELKSNDSIYYYITNENQRITLSISDSSEIEDVINLLNINGKFSEEKGLLGLLEVETAFKELSKLKGYTENIQAGHYILEGKYNINTLINTLLGKPKNILNFQIPENIRKIEHIFSIIENKLNFDTNSINKYLEESDFLSKNNFTLETLPSLFIPNTYELYSGISVKEFLDRMNLEYNKFWNKERKIKYDSLNFTRIEISILASIVEEEQKIKDIEDRKKIAGLYINRLNNPRDYPYLQADPTVKFANNDFEIKQVLDRHTSIDHPYNTYKNKGLPPGPICIPSIHAIDAVLNAENHPYTFMCAGIDGKHKFTSSNSEHNKHKNRYKKHEGFK